MKKMIKKATQIILAATLSLCATSPAFAAVRYGIEDVFDDTIWMGWTYYESGTAGYGSAGGDGGRAYGRYQMDYEYALIDFLQMAYESDPDTYERFLPFLSLEAGDEKLKSSEMQKTWVDIYGKNPDEFSELQDQFMYETYYLSAKKALMGKGIDLDEFDDPVLNGTVYSIAVRDGYDTDGLKAIWQTYRSERTINEWLTKIYEAEYSRHPSQQNRWNNEQKYAALSGGTTTAYLSEIGGVMSANGTAYVDHVAIWFENYPDFKTRFQNNGGWSRENREWAEAIRTAGDFFNLYGIKSGNLDFISGTSGGIYIDGVIISAENLSIPDNGSSMPIVYMAQSGGQPWSGVPFGGGTIASSGCSITSFAMIATYLTYGVEYNDDNIITPSAIVAAISNKYGNYNHFYVDGSGQSWDIFSGIAPIFGMKCNQIGSGSILSALSAGNPVIMSCKPGEFTSTGHFIVLTGLTDDGYITINDPNAAHAAYSYKKYPISYIVSQGKGWWEFYMEE